MKKSILSLLLLLGVASSDFIRDDTKGVVLDTKTNLMWQDNSEAKTTNKTWSEAITYCEGLSLGGFSDWHLPNYNELHYLADRSRYNPALSPKFVNVVSFSYWSATTVASNTSFAWGVDFHYGLDGWGDKTYSYYVRCVRPSD
jgi:hypothetical protein